MAAAAQEDLADSAPEADSDLGDGMPDRDLDHDLEQLCNDLTPAEAQRLRRYVDVYCDDYCCLCQGGPSFRAQARRHIFATIDRVFRPNDELDAQRQEPNSRKKLAKGDAAWTTRKRMLGWIIDTVRMTMTLPQSRREKIEKLLALFPRSKRRTTSKRWYKLLGVLRSIVKVIPGGMGLFCNLQLALLQHVGRIPLTPAVHDELDDWRRLLASVAARPTHLLEVLPPDAL